MQLPKNAGLPLATRLGAVAIATALRSRTTPNMNSTRENRVRILKLSPEMLVDIWNSLSPAGHMFLQLPVTEQLPEGTKVLCVNGNFETQTIDVIVTHESFSPVPFGERPPELPPMRHVTFVRVRKLTDPSDVALADYELCRQHPTLKLEIIPELEIITTERLCGMCGKSTTHHRVDDALVCQRCKARSYCV